MRKSADNYRLTYLMQCEHKKLKWKLVYRAIDIVARPVEHKQWLEWTKCCTTCGREIKL